MHRGNTLAEYGIIGGLVGMVCLGAFFILGNNLQSYMAGLKQDLQGTAQVATTAQAARQSRGSGQQGGSMTVTLSSGNQITVGPAGIADYRQSIATSGANGTTKVLASQISALAQQMQQSGTMSPAQMNTLMELANQAHKMAQIEQLIEQAAANASTPAEFKQTTIWYGGKAYTPKELAATIQWGQIGSFKLGEWTPDPTLTGPEMVRFDQLYREVLSSGALTDPVASQQVTDWSQQIAYIAQATNNATGAAGKDGYYADTSDPAEVLNRDTQSELFNEHQWLPAAAAGTPASTVTNSNAGNICTAGNGLDNGAQCQ